MTLVLQILHGDDRRMLATKKMSFPFSATVYDIFVAIKEKFEGISNLEEYALFRPNDEKNGIGEWLIPKRTLESYGFMTDDRIWFRRKMNIVNVLFPDGSTKKMRLDVCQPVKGLLQNIADKMGLHHPEAFGIQVAGTNKFLNMKKFLYQVADPDATITLYKRHFIQEGELSRDDPMLLHMSYIQAHDSIVSGHYPTNRDEVVKFGAYNAMIDIGKWDETKKEKSIKTNIAHFVPPMYQKKDIEKDIFNKWKSTPTMTPIDAKYKYLQLAMTLRSYGMNIYHGGVEPKNALPQAEGKKKKLDSVIMAFDPQKIRVFTPDFKPLVEEPYEHLKGWNYQDAWICFDFDKYNNGQKVVFYTNQSEDIYTLVAGYIEIITMKAQKTAEDDDVQVANEVQITKEKKKAAIKSKSVKTRIEIQPEQTAEMAKVQSLTDAYQANKSYALPVNFAVDIKEESHGDDDRWRSQLRDQSDKLLGLLKPLSESLRTKTKLSDEEIKKFGFHIDGIRNAILQGALQCQDKDTFEALSNNLMDALQEYLDCCSLVQSDPNNASYLKALNEAEQRVRMCLEAVNAASNGLLMELDQDVLMELAQSINVDIEESCELCKASPNNMDEEIANCHDASRMLMYGAQSMGLCLNDPSCAAMFKDLLSKCKNSALDLMEKSQLKGTPNGDELQEDVDDIVENCELLDDFIEEIRDDNVDARKRYLEAAGNILQMADWLHGLDNIRIDDVQKATIEMKKDIPLVIKYMKDYTSQPGIDDARRQFIVGNLKDMTSNAKIIFQNSDQAYYTEEHNGDIQEASGECHDALKAILGDEIKDVVHNAMFTDSKKAAINNLKLRAQLKKTAKKDKKNMDRLLKAAKATSEAMRKLLQPFDNEDAYIDNSLSVVTDYYAFEKELAALCDLVEEGRSDLIEEKTQLDSAMNKLEQDVRTYREEAMLNSLRDAALEYKIASGELKQEVLTNESKAELEEVGIKEELNEDAITELNALIVDQEILKELKEFDRKNADRIKDFSDHASRSLRAILKASRTTKKKNERKLLLDAAMKLSNDIAKLLYCVDDKSIGKNELNMEKAYADLVNDEKQLLAIIKMDDIDDLSEMESTKIEIPPEDIQKEKDASTKMKQVTEEIAAIQRELESEVQARKDNAKPDDPKQIMQIALQEAVVGMLNSSVAVMNNATEAQAELVVMLGSPQTASTVKRDPEYVDDLVAAVEDVRQTVHELQVKVSDENVSPDDLVMTSQNVGKKVERVVAKCRAGTKTKNKSNRYKDLLNASKLLADATKKLLDCAQTVEEFDDTPVVVNMPPPPPPVVIEEEEDIETFGIDEYTLREIEQQKKIFELEKKLEAAKKRKADLEVLKKNFE